MTIESSCSKMLTGLFLLDVNGIVIKQYILTSPFTGEALEASDPVLPNGTAISGRTLLALPGAIYYNSASPYQATE
ncbi:hypothetical protein KL86CLO1_12366 [uncultured Eubacteriales bacterium]|uniref:Uncharacterized protein n=1 Tax=uncultured Eubacteriales bacterium TaxID=172733 RepID=A0A212K8A6_9FIRM|nr:hypothetical protein KL86CLO1_12366 [uncultured Eubacteriales bacterium]